MSYFKHHVFFCCNQREPGETCCNAHDASAKGRMGVKLTIEKVRAIRVDKRKTKTIARHYGVSGTTIRLVQRRKTWPYA